MKLSEIMEELRILGITNDTELSLELSMARTGKVKEAKIFVVPPKKNKSKLALS